MVKKLDLSNVQPSNGDGGFVPLPEGAYVCEIVSVVDNDAREYLEVTFDIAEGEYAGYYSDEWGAAHPFAHSVKVSYKDSALGMLKAKLNALTASNPGFDAEAVFNAAADSPALLGMLHGRKFGMSVQLEYEDWQGKPLNNPRLDWGGAKWCTADEVRMGTVKPQRRDARHTPRAESTAAADAVVIPF